MNEEKSGIIIKDKPVKKKKEPKKRKVAQKTGEVGPYDPDNPDHPEFNYQQAIAPTALKDKEDKHKYTKSK